MTTVSDPSRARARADDRGFAIACLCGGVGLSAAMDATFKWLSGDYPVHQLLVMRCAAAFPILLAIMRFRDAVPLFRHPMWPAILVRGLVMGSAYLAFVLAIAAMPLADGVAIYFTMPLFIAALVGPFLGEKVPGYRWIAIIAGFIGVIVMIRPGNGLFEPAALLALYSAFCYAVGQMIARRIGLAVRPSVIAYHQNTIYLAVALVLAALFGSGGFSTEIHPSLDFLTRGWTWPSLTDLALMSVLGLLSALAMMLFTQAYQNAEANFVAPFEYTAMFWAAGYGFLVFGDVPGWATGLGGALVVGAGLFMLWRDRQAARWADMA